MSLRARQMRTKQSQGRAEGLLRFVRNDRLTGLCFAMTGMWAMTVTSPGGEV